MEECLAKVHSGKELVEDIITEHIINRDILHYADANSFEGSF